MRGNHLQQRAVLWRLGECRFPWVVDEPWPGPWLPRWARRTSALSCSVCTPPPCSEGGWETFTAPSYNQTTPPHHPPVYWLWRCLRSPLVLLVTGAHIEGDNLNVPPRLPSLLAPVGLLQDRDHSVRWERVGTAGSATSYTREAGSATVDCLVPLTLLQRVRPSSSGFCPQPGRSHPLSMMVRPSYLVTRSD